MTLKDDIREYVFTYDHVSYVELENRFGEQVIGEYAIYLDNKGSSNMLIWTGMSEELSMAIQELVAEQKIEHLPCSAVVYGLDGRILALPVATKIKKYTTPHWLPCVLSTHGANRREIDRLKGKKPIRVLPVHDAKAKYIE
jgi:hypothetical protein